MRINPVFTGGLSIQKTQKNMPAFEGKPVKKTLHISKDEPYRDYFVSSDIRRLPNQSFIKGNAPLTKAKKQPKSGTDLVGTIYVADRGEYTDDFEINKYSGVVVDRGRGHVTEVMASDGDRVHDFEEVKSMRKANFKSYQLYQRKVAEATTEEEKAEAEAKLAACLKVKAAIDKNYFDAIELMKKANYDYDYERRRMQGRT